MRAEGKTVEQAIENGLKALGITAEMAEVKVVRKQSAFRQAVVEVNVKKTDGLRVKEFVEGLIAVMGLPYQVELRSDDDEIFIELIGECNGDIIGYRGEVLNGIQYLASLLVNTDKSTFKRVIIDAEGYRNKRENTLVGLALNLEKKVIRTKRSVKLEPMNPYERRIIHSSLQNSAHVLTKSEGEEPRRYVVILPKGAAISEDSYGVTKQRKKLVFAYRSDKKKRR